MMMPSIFGEDLLNDWMDFSFPDIDKKLYGKRANQIMKTDVKETDTGYEVDIDLPGFKKEDVKAELHDGYLNISAKKSNDNDEKDNDGNIIRRERYSGSCSRSFYVGDDIKQEDIKASYNNGELIITLPKEAPKQVETKSNFIPIE